MKKLALSIFAILFSLFVIRLSLVSAQERLPLTVAPARQQISVNPGGSVTSVTKFFNESDAPVAGNFKVVDFIVTSSDGSPTLLFEGNLANRFSGASWIKLVKDKAMIGAGAVERLQYTITAPKDAAPGGRYVAIFFEPTGAISQETAATAGNSISSVLPRIAGLVYIRVNGPVAEMAFVKNLSAPSFLEYGPVKITAEITNKGDYHITPVGKISLIDMLGRKVDEEVLEKQNVFPDSTRRLEYQLGSKLLLGKYKVRLAATYGESGKAFSQEVTFWAFPFRAVIITVLTLVILILLTKYLWRRFKGKQVKLEQELKTEISEIESLKAKYKDVVTQSNQPKDNR